AEVVLCDEVGTATLLVRHHRVAVRDDEDGQQRGDAEGDGKRVAERGAAGQDEHQENFLGRVRHRRERVGGEHRERHGLAEPLVAGLRERYWRTDQQALEERKSHTPVRLYAPQRRGWHALGNFYEFLIRPPPFLTRA